MHMDEDEGFLLTNMGPKRTGLNAVVWLRVCEEGTPLIMHVSETFRLDSPAYKLDIGREAIIQKDENAEFMTLRDFHDLWTWMKQNGSVIQSHCRGHIDSAEMAEGVMPIKRTREPV